MNDVSLSVAVPLATIVVRAAVKSMTTSVKWEQVPTVA
jgi:hypothetical protein